MVRLILVVLPSGPKYLILHFLCSSSLSHRACRCDGVSGVTGCGVNFSVLSGVPTGRTRPKKGVGLFPTATRNQARGTTYFLLGFDDSEMALFQLGTPLPSRRVAYHALFSSDCSLFKEPGAVSLHFASTRLRLPAEIAVLSFDRHSIPNQPTNVNRFFIQANDI